MDQIKGIARLKFRQQLRDGDEPARCTPGKPANETTTGMRALIGSSPRRQPLAP
jgi:hypothetical protein